MRSWKVDMGNSSDYNRIWIVGFGITSSVVLLTVLSRPWFFDNHHHQHHAEMEKTMYIKASKGEGYPPIIAYWICGSNGDSERMVRLLKAIYHPRNQYLLQLDSDSSDQERRDLLVSINSEALFRCFRNVNVVGRSYGINRQGASALAAILHASALLLKLNQQWDWFINLTPFHYPVITQDDLLHALTALPRNVNFIHYFTQSDLEKQNIDQIVMDPSLYLEKKSDLFYAVERRRRPNAFRVFGGSPWMVLTRELIEYCIQGWENLPRKLLMYLNNVPNPIQFYFHTVTCNTPHFQNKTILNPHLITFNFNANYHQMLASGAAFAFPFKHPHSSLLNTIDQTILNRPPHAFVPGKWLNINCSTLPTTSNTIDSLKPGIRGTKLAFFFSHLQIDAKLTAAAQCRS